MIVLRRIHEPRVTAAAAVIVRHELLAAAAREHQVRIEIIGLQVHGERLIRPDRQDPALEVGGIARELGILGREITRDGLPDLDQPCNRAESAADRVGRRARATPSQRQMVFPQLGGGARVRVDAIVAGGRRDEECSPEACRSKQPSDINPVMFFCNGLLPKQGLHWLSGLDQFLFK